ncbi:hypothetical protein [Actinoplanes sp. NPDC049265]|uniref:hypothetical protein n=1 Tax=Actinoplanes sp. NPDC049265 TaxID=3363902 RepID=UPI00371B766B
MAVLPEPDEPTWEVRQPKSGRSGMSRFDGRTRSILIVAAVVAIVVNAGVAWAYWRIAGSETSVRAGATVELALRARSDLNRPLRPGGTGNLTVTLTNDYDFPIRITTVRPALGAPVADDEHRDSGCRDPKVTMTRESFEVNWDVAKNTIGAFSIPDALTLAEGTPAACHGATFTVPIQVSGLSQGQ